MKYLLICLALAGLSACVSKITVIDERGVQTTLSESLYAHKLSTEAFEKTANASASCYERATTELGLAICGLSARGGQAAQAPQWIPPKTWDERVVAFGPFALGAGQIYAQVDTTRQQTKASVLIAGINANRELGIVNAATGSNERIATLGFTAISNVASDGFSALRDSSVAASNAGAQNSTAWAEALAALPPTTQIIAGRDVIQARDVDQSVTAGDRVNGDGNRLRNTVDCIAGGGDANANAGGLSAATAPIATSPSVVSPLNVTYNPLVSATTAPVSNDCGNG